MKTLRLQTGLLLFLVLISFSCKKKKAISPLDKSKNICPLLSIADETGKSIQDYEYIESKLVRIYDRDSIPTTLIFRYNEKKQVNKMQVQSDNSSENFDVLYFYDDQGNVARTKASIAGIEFMENTFVITDKKITSVETVINLFGRSIGAKTRIEYNNNNVSKVYSSVDNDPELLAFVGESYDDKPQFSPPVYKIAALGFVGVANNFFSFMGDNNLVSGKIYDEKGKVDQKMDFAYIYDKKGLPMQCQTTVLRNGVSFTKSTSFQFACNN